MKLDLVRRLAQAAAGAGDYTRPRRLDLFTPRAPDASGLDLSRAAPSPFESDPDAAAARATINQKGEMDAPPPATPAPTAAPDELDLLYRRERALETTPVTDTPGQSRWGGLKASAHNILPIAAESLGRMAQQDPQNFGLPEILTTIAGSVAAPLLNRRVDEGLERQSQLDLTRREIKTETARRKDSVDLRGAEDDIKYKEAQADYYGRGGGRSVAANHHIITRKDGAYDLDLTTGAVRKLEGIGAEEPDPDKYLRESPDPATGVPRTYDLRHPEKGSTPVGGYGVRPATGESAKPLDLDDTYLASKQPQQIQAAVLAQFLAQGRRMSPEAEQLINALGGGADGLAAALATGKLPANSIFTDPKDSSAYQAALSAALTEARRGDQQLTLAYQNYRNFYAQEKDETKRAALNKQWLDYLRQHIGGSGGGSAPGATLPVRPGH